MHFQNEFSTILVTRFWACAIVSLDSIIVSQVYPPYDMYSNAMNRALIRNFLNVFFKWFSKFKGGISSLH